MADSEFPRRGGGGNAKPKGGTKNLLFGQVFPENCMKMNEIGPGGHIPGAPLRSATVILEPLFYLKMTRSKITFCLASWFTITFPLTFFIWHQKGNYFHSQTSAMQCLSIQVRIKKAWLPCWPVYSQQVSCQKWIWGSHKQESMRMRDLPSFETSLKVQNSGTSGYTKRTYVLQKFI